MKRFRQSLLLSLGIVLVACVLSAAAAGVHPAKKCYNSDGEEIPCPSNYSQTQFAARATRRETGPTAPANAPARAASPTPTPTLTPTNTAPPTEAPTQALIPVQTVPPPATPAPQVASSPSGANFVPLALLLGCMGLVVLVLLVLLWRWLSGRRQH
jgi:hypothetical protein